MKSGEVLPVPPALRELTAVVLGVFSRGGIIVDGNRGLKYILDLEANAEIRGREFAGYFMQPRFEEFLAGTPDADGIVYEGLLNLGQAETRFRSLRGSVSRDGEHLILLAEFDIAEMEGLNDTVLQLNDEMATVQRELMRANRKLKQNEARIQELVRRDPLTDLPNRRAFDERMEFELAHATRNGGRFCLAILDIDHFKEVNDSHGHNAGDRALQYFTSLFADNMRNIDFFARIGGEEFAVILPNTTPETAYEVMERLRRNLETSHCNDIGKPLTASFGISGNRLDGDSATTLKERADQALYQAKETGRNRVCVSA